MPSATIRAIDNDATQYDYSVQNLITRFPRDLRVPAVLLIDDDASFRAKMRTVARHENIPFIDVADCSQLASLGIGDFSCAIVTHRANGLDGFSISELISDLFGMLPVIIIAESPVLTAAEDWPLVVSDVMPKSLGPYAIFNCVLETYEWSLLRQEMRSWSH